MKLCPKCDFIYEDDQAFCDMDGKELTSIRSLRSRIKLPFRPNPEGWKSRARIVSPSHWQRPALLASLFSFVYLAQRRQLQNSAPSVQLPTAGFERAGCPKLAGGVDRE